MGTLNDFLDARPDISIGETVPTELPDTAQDSVSVTVIILAADNECVVIAHLGKRFVVKREDVIDVSETSAATPNPFGRGAVAAITLRKDAQLMRQETLRASDLTAATPFVISRPSLAVGISRPLNTPREIIWRRENRLPVSSHILSASETDTYTQTVTNSSSQSPVSSISTADGGDVDQDYSDDDSLPDDSNYDDQIADD